MFDFHHHDLLIYGPADLVGKATSNAGWGSSDLTTTQLKCSHLSLSLDIPDTRGSELIVIFQ